jgi:chromate transporter
VSAAPRPAVGLAALFLGFLRVGLSGFGGTLPWARRMLVEERRWFDETEFTEALGVCQLLPGPNVINLSIFVGARFHGVGGALAAFAGLTAAPFAVVLLLATAYGHVAQAEAVRRVFAALASAVSGLVLAMAIKMALPLRRDPRALLFGGAAAVAAAGLHVPVVGILLGLGPLAVALAWRRRA